MEWLFKNLWVKIPAIVCVISFSTALTLFVSCELYDMNRYIYGYITRYGSGRDSVIAILFLAAFLTLANFHAMLNVDRQNAKYTSLGYNIMTRDAIRRAQAVVSIFLALLCVAVTIDVCLNGR
ncbi:membrane hypothetical protein [Mesorhizobium delmotii]|uniref:Uncharacterized protein n=1 Tax=Mesorhizobium delmotii TaxID=1631247 RepID=A0A2P9AIA5_9HYPH|nr:membrane hypothetical protein [Mesorhizobium delmotii]